MSDNSEILPAAEPAPSHIILETDCLAGLAGKVLRATPGMVAALDAAGAKYRDATAREISIAGVA